jgi:hypothetical protein
MIYGAAVMMLGMVGLVGWFAGVGKLARISWRYIPMARKPVDFHQFAEAVRALDLYWVVLNEPPPLK